MTTTLSSPADFAPRVPAEAGGADRIGLLQFVTLFGVGGTERHLVNLSRALDRSVFDLQLACMNRSGPFLKEFEEQDIPISEYPVRNLYGAGSVRQRLRFAGELTSRRVAIVHSYNFHSNVFAIPAARLARTPVVLASIRDTGSHLSPAKRRAQRQICRLADRVLVNADAIRRQLVSEGYADSKIRVIHNGIDLDRFADLDRHAAPPLRRELGLPDGSPLVALLARLDPVKRIEDFIDAAALVAARVDEARFLIVGDDIVAANRPGSRETDYRSRLIHQVDRLGLTGRLILTGTRLDVAHFLSQVAVSVLPSSSEGLSNTILESMAAGVPVVATAVGGTPEIVDDGVTGLLVPPREPAALAQAILKLLEQPELARRLGGAGREKVQRSFNLRRMVTETERLYAQLLDRARRRSYRHQRNMVACSSPIERPSAPGATRGSPATDTVATPSRLWPGQQHPPTVVRSWSKARLSRVLCAVSGDRLVGHLTGAARSPLVVGYHRVVERVDRVEASPIAQMSIGVRMFEQQLDWLARRYRVVSLDELAAQLDDGYSPRKPLAAITFDDGYADVFEHAVPVLMRKGIPAAIFVVTDWIGTTGLLVHDRLYRLLALGWPRSRDVLARRGLVEPGSRRPPSAFESLRHLLAGHTSAELSRLCAILEEALDVREEPPASLRPLSWKMVAAMHRAGITIGSHTERHPVLTRETGATVLAEVAGSRETLRQRLGTEVRYFAYPDGAYNAGVVKAVARAGYRLAFTACRHRDRHHRLLTIPRALVWENSCLDANREFSPAILSCLANGVFDLRSECRQTHRSPA
jgi:glycosyltransferase involved in cell wall biosynthesis/peptidoglycan/xylan/chitin deacetylase (PgdA/CDA1 family)